MTESPHSSPSPAMRLQSTRYALELTQQPIHYGDLIEAVRHPHCGAVVAFLGTVRELTAGRQTVSLEYEAYPEMALSELKQLAEEITQQWDLQQLVVVHRLGPLALGEIAVGIAVSAPHRQAAFAATADMMERIKRSVPIWKKEFWADGAQEWIHPGEATS